MNLLHVYHYTCGRVYEKYCLKTLKKLEKYPTSNSCVGMSFHQWKVSKVCKIIFSLQTFRLKQFGALQTSICTHKAQTKIFSSKCCLFVDQKNDFFFEVSERVCLVCTHTLWGAKGLFGSICLPKPVRYLGEPPLVLWRHWWKFVKIAIFPQKHPYDRIFWWSKMSLGVRSTPQNFFGRQWRSKAFPKIFLAINIMWLGF